MLTDSFLDRPRALVRTSAGAVELPVLYRDASALHAFFRVEHRRAAAVLAGSPFTPVRFAGDKAIAAITAYDYRVTSVGPYRELGVALAVVPWNVAVPKLALLHLLREGVHRDVGWHVLDLPVTTEIAEVGGRELWGFPKFTTVIDVDLSDARRILAVVQAPVGEEAIASLEGHAGPGAPVGAMDLVLYTVMAGRVLRTSVETRGTMHTGLGRGVTLRVGRASHPMADRLLALGLDRARPFAAQVCRDYRAVLHLGVPIHAGAAHAA